MFDQLFERASTIARHATAPFAEERIRYLDYCGQRGDSHAWKLRKADDLLWIARKLSTRTDLQVYGRLLPMAAIVTGPVVLNSICSRHANDSLVRLVHGFGILAIFANRLRRFLSDHDWTNTATGRNMNVVLATPALIVSVAQSACFCDGMVRLDSPYPVSTRTMLMPTLLLGVAKDGRASPFETL